MVVNIFIHGNLRVYLRQFVFISFNINVHKPLGRWPQGKSNGAINGHKYFYSWLFVGLFTEIHVYKIDINAHEPLGRWPQGKSNSAMNVHKYF